MEQSFATEQAATSTPYMFGLNSPGSSISLQLSTQQHPSPPPPGFVPSLSGFPGLALSTTIMSQAALGSVPPSVRFTSSPSLPPDPPAAGPAAAAMPSTQRLRAAVLNAATAAAATAPAASRRTRSSRRAGPGPASSGILSAVAAASEPSPEPPRRSTRTRKRAPTASSVASSARGAPKDPPTKKQKRANLKAPPPANAKSDDDDEPEKTASCCICMDEPKPADLASINGCKHLFCFECIDKWAERENSCPLCKVRFVKIDRVNKARRKKGGPENTKKVKQKDQRSDIAPGAALEGLLASFASSANFPPHRVARLIFSGMGAAGNPFAVLPSSLGRSRAAGAAAAARANALEDSLFSSDTDDDEADSFMPAGATSFADLFRAVPVRRAPGIIVGSGLGGRGISLTHAFDPPSTGRNYASNGSDRNAGRLAENPLEIEDDSEDEEDVEVVQVTRPV